MYTREQKQIAVETYLKIGSLHKTIRNLGYPGVYVNRKFGQMLIEN